MRERGGGKRETVDWSLRKTKAIRLTGVKRRKSGRGARSEET